LKNGHTRSCGCYRRDVSGRRRKEATRPLAERFWEKVDRSSGCWTWRAQRDAKGYGLFAVSRGVPGRAHRIAWELEYGPIPGGSWVLHRCDNPPCVRPEHLFLGDAAVNARDAQQKGRRAAGERHGIAKLTTAQVAAIRLARARGETGPSIAARYGVSKTTVYHIATKKTWRGRTGE
jgi:hypothetical protein